MSETTVFNKIQQAYIEWCATPRHDRIPATQVNFGREMVKRSDKTLQRWQKLPGFWDAVLAQSRQNLREQMPNVYGAIWREAEKGSAPHAKMALELTGEAEPAATEGTLVIRIEYADNHTDIAKAARRADDDNRKRVTA